MIFFDFHHHNESRTNGIYNLPLNSDPTESFFSAGIHPSMSGTITNDDFIWLEEIVKHRNCLAIGECGLDGLVKVDDKTQEFIFDRQIELANDLQKPLIIHCVRRFSQMLQFKKQAKVPMIIHGFNKRKSIGEELQKYDFYLSFGKAILHHVNLQEFATGFPIEKLVLETDDSDCELELIFRKMAGLKKIPVEKLIDQIEKYLEIFNIPR